MEDVEEAAKEVQGDVDEGQKSSVSIVVAFLALFI